MGRMVQIGDSCWVDVRTVLSVTVYETGGKYHVQINKGLTNSITASFDSIEKAMSAAHHIAARADFVEPKDVIVASPQEMPLFWPRPQPFVPAGWGDPPKG